MTQVIRAWRLARSWLVWGWRLHSLGSRTVLGGCRMVSNARSISIGHHSTLGDGWALVDLQDSNRTSIPKIRIGSFCSILYDFQCNASTSVEVQDYVLIAPRVFISDSDHVVDAGGERTTLSRQFRSAPVVIEHNCWLGVNAVILKGVTVGHHAVVAANAVVTRDVAPCTIVAGVPAKPIGCTGASGSRPANRANAS